MTHREAVIFVLLRTLSNLLLLFSIYGVLATFGPALYYELQLRLIETKNVHFVVPQADQIKKESVEKQNGSGFANILTGSQEQILKPKDTLFSITIPKIGASAKIIPNIDPSNSQEFLPVLQKGIAHARGSVFPGMQGNIYLFAHSTDNWWDVGRYNAVFYLLKDLSVGDDIIIFFENRRYDYVVSQSLITEPTDVSLIARDQNGLERLVLQTCWPPGTTWKRLFVVAVPKSEQ